MQVVRFLELWWWWIDLGATLLAIVSMPSVLLRRRGRPLAALSWILAMLALPLVGLFLWWLFGRRHLERRRRRRRRAHETIAQQLSRLRESLEAPPSDAQSLIPFRYLPAELVHSVFPPTTGNAVELLANGAQAFDAMEADIQSATHHIHALFYIWKNDETGCRFRDLLIEKAKQGVRVRVLCDAFGSPALNTKFARPLRRAGARVVRFSPFRLAVMPRFNFRNHRKILVVDGRVGIIGGFNIGHEYRTRWRDMGVRIEGPAVDQLQAIFADDWFYAARQNLAEADYFGRWSLHRKVGQAVAAIASGPDTLLSPLHDALFMAINRAEERIFITTPYFIPSHALAIAIRTAVFRGVEVRIMLPARNDVWLVRYAARSFYPDLLAVGVRIFEYQPEMLHAKALVFDRDLSVIGSANLDSRSFRLNFESSCFVGGSKLNGALAAQFEQDMESCKELTSRGFERMPWHSKLLDSTAHLLSPLL